MWRLALSSSNTSKLCTLPLSIMDLAKYTLGDMGTEWTSYPHLAVSAPASLLWHDALLCAPSRGSSFRTPDMLPGGYPWLR